MHKLSHRWFSHLITCCSLSFLFCVSTVWAQGGRAPGGMDSPTSDTSRSPFRIKLSGFLNTNPEEGSKVLKLGINAFGETYQFELIKAESLDDKQVGEMAILHKSASTQWISI